MYLKKLHLKNIKCFEDVTLEFPHKDGDYSGWNVILGENGVGKSTIVRSAAELVMESHGDSWIYDEEWVSHHAKAGEMAAVLLGSRFDDPELRGGGATRAPTVSAEKQLEMEVSIEHMKWERDPRTHRPKKINTPGWLACGYGPFRRLAWRPPQDQFPPYQLPFLTLLSDANGLAEPINWLQTMYARSLDRKLSGREEFARTWPIFVKIVNQLLKDGIRIKDVSTEAVVFETRERGELKTFQLSDGYRSCLALVLDLLMHIYNATSRFADYVVEDKETGWLSILAEGIVLIDEADAHLHPSWQRELGEQLCKVFPKIQFIVTTHSPFIAQEATDGGLFVLRPTKKGTVEVEKFEESIRGWTATQILTSSLFGLHSTRSVDTEALIRESAELTAKELGGKLTAREKRRISEVQQLLSQTLSAPGETYDEMKRQQDMANYVDNTLKRLKNGKS